MGLRVGFSELTLERLWRLGIQELGGYPDWEYAQNNGEATIPFFFPDMELEAVFDDGELVVIASEDSSGN
jgi:hypothetical protein